MHNTTARKIRAQIHNTTQKCPTCRNTNYIVPTATGQITCTTCGHEQDPKPFIERELDKALARSAEPFRTTHRQQRLTAIFGTP